MDPRQMGNGCSLQHHNYDPDYDDCQDNDFDMDFGGDFGFWTIDSAFSLSLLTLSLSFSFYLSSRWYANPLRSIDVVRQPIFLLFIVSPLFTEKCSCSFRPPPPRPRQSQSSNLVDWKIPFNWCLHLFIWMKIQSERDGRVLVFGRRDTQPPEKTVIWFIIMILISFMIFFEDKKKQRLKD